MVGVVYKSGVVLLEQLSVPACVRDAGLARQNRSVCGCLFCGIVDKLLSRITTPAATGRVRWCQAVIFCD